MSVFKYRLGLVTVEQYPQYIQSGMSAEYIQHVDLDGRERVEVYNREAPDSENRIESVQDLYPSQHLPIFNKKMFVVVEKKLINES